LSVYEKFTGENDLVDKIGFCPFLEAGKSLQVPIRSRIFPLNDGRHRFLRVPWTDPTSIPMLTILEFPDPRLRTKAQPVTTFDKTLHDLIDAMFATMYAAPGIGLAATQVNEHKQLLVLDVSEEKNQPLVLINPKVVERDGEQVYQEGCLSVPGIFADVERAEHVVVEAQDRHGQPLRIEAHGLLAVCIQHEMDHLIGKLFVDYLSPLKRELVRKKLEKQRKAAAPEAAHA